MAVKLQNLHTHTVFGDGRNTAEEMVRAAIAAGCDGLIIEVHNDPIHALCDGQQSITPGQFKDLMGKAGAVAACVGREM